MRPLDFVREMCQKYNVSFGGNLQLTMALLMETEKDVRRNTIETMDSGGDIRFILAPGCDLPYATPPEHLRLVADIVHIKEKEAVEFMLGLMVRNIPTICIDGQITFVSTIPSQQELIHAIQKRINEKMALRIKQRRNEVVVLGGGGEKCENLWENMQQAVKELGSQVELTRIKDEQAIYEYGVPSTPAVVVVRKQIKSAGRVPSVEVIKEWIKDLEESPRFS